jgi:hypothetical protein
MRNQTAGMSDCRRTLGGLLTPTSSQSAYVCQESIRCALKLCSQRLVGSTLRQGPGGSMAVNSIQKKFLLERHEMKNLSHPFGQKRFVTIPSRHAFTPMTCYSPACSQMDMTLSSGGFPPPGSHISIIFRLDMTIFALPYSRSEASLIRSLTNGTIEATITVLSAQIRPPLSCRSTRRLRGRSRQMKHCDTQLFFRRQSDLLPVHPKY